MNQFRGLLLNRADHVGMAMSGRTNCDSGGEIEEHISIHVFDHGAAAALGDEWIIARERGRHEFGVALDDIFCFRPGQSSNEPGRLCFRCGDHEILQVVD